MKKLYFTFFIIISAFNYLSAQTEYGLLFISDVNPREEQEQTVGVHQISFGNQMLYFYPNDRYTPIMGRQDFFYAVPVDNKIYFNFNSDHRGCFISENPVFDVTSAHNSNNGSEVYFVGCFATTVPYLIHLFPSEKTEYCTQETIELNNGWNWRYKFDNQPWQDFPGSYQEQRSISFKLSDLTGFDGKSTVHFQTGYNNNYTNIITYDIISCSPKVESITEENYTSCTYSEDGSVTVVFKRDLENNETFAFNFYTKDNALIPTPDITADVPNRKYTFSGLKQGEYYIKYQTFIGNQQTSVNEIPYPTFKILPPTPFEFKIIETQPSCNGQSGKIQIQASGGTGPYSYSINTGDEVEFSSITNEITLPEGDYYIKVIDKKGCIDTNAKDEKI